MNSIDSALPNACDERRSECLSDSAWDTIGATIRQSEETRRHASQPVEKLAEDRSVATGKNAHPTAAVGWAFLPDSGSAFLPPIDGRYRMCYREGISSCFLEDRSGIFLAVEGRKMGDESADQGGQRSELRSGLIDEACSRFETAWQTGQQPRIEDFLPAESPDKSGATQLNLLVQLVGIDLEWRWKTADMPAGRNVASAHPLVAQEAWPDASDSSVPLPRTATVGGLRCPLSVARPGRTTPQ